jgi:hypothetical protein
LSLSASAPLRLDHKDTNLSLIVLDFIVVALKDGILKRWERSAAHLNCWGGRKSNSPAAGV